MAGPADSTIELERKRGVSIQQLGREADESPPTIHRNTRILGALQIEEVVSFSNTTTSSIRFC